MGIVDYIEVSLSWLLKNAKGRDAKAFTKRPAFADFPNPTMEINSPDCGPSNSDMKVEFTAIGAERFPELSWAAPASDVKEYLVVIEDPDAPLPTPVLHGLFYALPPSTTHVKHDDTTPVGDSKQELTLKGGYKWAKNIRGAHYGGPRPLLNHGPHRYFYQVVALKEPLSKDIQGPGLTREQVAENIVGKVAGWGIWVGSFERQWK